MVICTDGLCPLFYVGLSRWYLMAMYLMGNNFWCSPRFSFGSLFLCDIYQRRWIVFFLTQNFYYFYRALACSMLFVSISSRNFLFSLLFFHIYLFMCTYEYVNIYIYVQVSIYLHNVNMLFVIFTTRYKSTYL